MKQVADLHIHSKYSRACSRDLTLENIDKTCRAKGIDIIATGDFTYPEWFKSIKEDLEEIGGSGLFKLRNAEDEKVKFVLSTEFALIYKKDGRCRRIHMVVQAPGMKQAEELNACLDKNYNIRSDGRPILGMSIEDLFGLCLGIDPGFLIYPAHIWTPWFSVFGSKSGFDSLEEAFGPYLDKVHAYETGLSSDPEMNWRLSQLDKLTLLSNSDAHSLPNLAREANVFDLKDASYKALVEAIQGKSKSNRLLYTLEFYPEEGMYHFDGHRSCGISFDPEKTKKNRGICPVCKKPLIIGVMNRVEELADRPEGFRPDKAPGFRKLVELDKIIAESLGIKSRRAKSVEAVYKSLTAEIGPELSILLDSSLDDIARASSRRVAEGVRRVREGELSIIPGFDGQYGKIMIFKEEEKNRQASLI